jgi:adenylate cyclase
VGSKYKKKIILANSAKRNFLFGLFFLFTFNILAQEPVNSLNDSLENVISGQFPDSSKVNAYNRLVRLYLYKDPAKALSYVHKALELAKRSEYTYGTCFSNLLLGIYYKNSGDFLKAATYTFRAIRVAEENNFNQELVIGYGNLGNINYMQVNLPDALKYFEQSLKYAKRTGEPQGISRAMNNVAIVYYDQKKYDKALNYFNDALEFAKQAGDKEVMTNFKASIANVYNKQGRKSEALKLYREAEEETKAFGNKKLICESLNNIANFYAEQGEYKNAVEKFEESEAIAEETGNTDLKKIAYEGLAKGYANLGDYKKAFTFHQLFKSTADSLNQADVTRKQTQMEMSFDFEKKEAGYQADIKVQRNVRNFSIGMLAAAILLLFMVYNRYLLKRRTNLQLEEKNRVISAEKERSEELLLNILPYETAQELKDTGKASAKRFDDVTVLFTDFKGFTNVSESLGAEELVEVIDLYFRKFDEITSKFKVEKIKTIGDAYMAAAGLPVKNKTHATDLVAAALEIQQFVAATKEERAAQNKPYFELRIGMHSGPIVAGIVGIKKFAYDIWGDTVNTASRMETSGEIGKVNISGETYEKIKHVYNCEYRGKIQAKNKGEIDMYFVTGNKEVIA